MRRVGPALVLACAAVSLSMAQGSQTFTGVITDDMCPLGDHGRMRMGANDAECTRACITAHGASYVLYDGARAYVLSDQRTPEQFAARTVRVVGTLEPATMTIRVESISAENAGKQAPEPVNPGTY